MYSVLCSNVIKGSDLPFDEQINLCVADLERAVVLANYLNKISTPEVSYAGISIFPVNSQDHEKEK